MPKSLDGQNTYELMLILKSSVDSKKQKEALTKIKKHFSSYGKIIKEKDWGKKMFTYPIKKEKEGNYFIFTLEMPGKEAKKLAERFKHNEVVLRHLLIRR